MPAKAKSTVEVPEDKPEVAAPAEPAKAPVAEVAAPPEPETAANETVADDAEEPAPKTYKDWREAIADADPDELLKDDRIAGRIGQVAEKRARDLKRQEEEKLTREKETEEAKQDQEYLRKLRKTDFDAYNSEMDKREASREAIQKEAGRARALATDFTGRLDKWANERFPKSVVEKFANTTYEGDFIDGVIHYIDDMESAHRDEIRKEIEKELRPALRKQLLTELNGGEAPESASGTKGKAKEQDYQTELECAEAFERGEINQQELLSIYRRHHWR